MEKFNGPRSEIAWYYTSLLAAFELRGAPVDLLIPLREVVNKLARALDPMQKGGAEGNLGS